MIDAGCPAPATCPVPHPDTVDLRRLRLHRWPAGTRAWTTTRKAVAPRLFNDSGVGDARFSPIGPPTAVGGPNQLAVLYLARSLTVSLLETAFHEVHATRPRRISAPIDLEPRESLQVAVPMSLALIDLRDEALEQLGIRRDQLVATSPAHYPCTRRWAEQLALRTLGSTVTVGFVWRSRIAELARADHVLLEDLLDGDRVDVAMIVGHPHTDVPVARDRWHPPGSGLEAHPSLDRGTGRAIMDEVATLLDATIVDR